MGRARTLGLDARPGHGAGVPLARRRASYASEWLIHLDQFTEPVSPCVCEAFGCLGSLSFSNNGQLCSANGACKSHAAKIFPDPNHARRNFIEPAFYLDSVSGFQPCDTAYFGTCRTDTAYLSFGDTSRIGDNSWEITAPPCCSKPHRLTFLAFNASGQHKLLNILSSIMCSVTIRRHLGLNIMT